MPSGAIKAKPDPGEAAGKPASRGARDSDGSTNHIHTTGAGKEVTSTPSRKAGLRFESEEEAIEYLHSKSLI